MNRKLSPAAESGVSSAATEGAARVAQAARVCQAAQARLRESGYPAVRRLSCTFHEGILVVHGELPSYFLKQMAQSMLTGLEGVVEILNRAEVRDGD